MRLPFSDWLIRKRGAPSRTGIKPIAVTVLTPLIVVLGLLDPAANAEAQVWVDAYASPNPYQPGDWVSVGVSASWSFSCEACWADHTDVSLWGSDGAYGSDRYYEWDYTLSDSAYWTFWDGDPGQYLYGDVSYSVQVLAVATDATCWCELDEYGSAFTSTSLAAPPTPEISGSDTIWWFNGESPDNYNTSVTLTSSAGADTAWEVQQGSDKVSLSTGSGSSTTVTSTGFSSAPGDIVIAATAHGATGTFAITSLKPSSLSSNVNTHIVTICPIETWGYETRIYYVPMDQFDNTLPSPVPVNEDWTTEAMNDWPGTDWTHGPPQGQTPTQNVVFGDQIQGALSTQNPTTACGNGSHVQHWGQAWFVGSATPGHGVRVQWDYLLKNRGNAVHDSVTGG